MKSIKHLFTTLLLLCATMATAHDFYVNGIYYNITDATNKTVEVTYQGDYYYSYDNEYTGNVVIPESFISNGKSYTVTSIEHDAFAFCSGLTSIVIPGSVTSIGNAAFNRCYSLKELHIADGEGTLNLGYSYLIDNTGKPLFYDCPLETLYLGRDLDYSGKFTPSPFNDKTTLTSVTIGNRVTSIGYKAFWSCKGLKSIEIPNSVKSIGNRAFDNTAWYNNQPNGVVYAGKVLYTYKGTMPANTSITIKDGTLGITEDAFSGCTGLTSIEIPNSVTSIGGSAFSGCTSLTNITIPNSVTSIENRAFNGCSGLTSITIPNSVTSIGNYAFDGCSGLTSITIPNSITSIGGSAFSGCSGLTSITIPNSVTSIGESAFSGCTGLTAVHISDLAAWCNIDFANSDANPLYNAKNLYINGDLVTNLVIPNSVTSIGSAAFANCINLKSITIHDGVKTIGESAFSECSKVETIYIGNSIESIKEYAFANCNNIFEIEIASKKAITASGNVFSNDAYNNVCLYVPKDRKFAYEKTTPWKNFYIVEKDFTGNNEVLDEVKSER